MMPSILFYYATNWLAMFGSYSSLLYFSFTLFLLTVVEWKLSFKIFMQKKRRRRNFFIFMTILFIFSLLNKLQMYMKKWKMGKKFILIPRKREGKKYDMDPDSYQQWVFIFLAVFICLTQHNFHFRYVEWLLNILFLFNTVSDQFLLM
jgi:hypothetical protein